MGSWTSKVKLKKIEKWDTLVIMTTEIVDPILKIDQIKWENIFKKKILSNYNYNSAKNGNIEFCFFFKKKTSYFWSHKKILH